MIFGTSDLVEMDVQDRPFFQAQLPFVRLRDQRSRNREYRAHSAKTGVYPLSCGSSLLIIYLIYYVARMQPTGRSRVPGQDNDGSFTYNLLENLILLSGNERLR